MYKLKKKKLNCVYIFFEKFSYKNCYINIFFDTAEHCKQYACQQWSTLDNKKKLKIIVWQSFSVQQLFNLQKIEITNILLVEMCKQFKI